jgi:hypothetical protein
MPVVERKHRNFAADQIIPAQYAFAVVPDDGADLPQLTRGVYLGSGGNLHCSMQNGDEITFVGMVGGVVHPIAACKIFATGTTAADIVGVY